MVAGLVGTMADLIGIHWPTIVTLQSIGYSGADPIPARFPLARDQYFGRPGPKGGGELGQQEKDHAKNQRTTEVEVSGWIDRSADCPELQDGTQHCRCIDQTGSGSRAEVAAARRTQRRRTGKDCRGHTAEL